MRTIWKYDLKPINGPQVVKIPYNAGPVNCRHVEFQGEDLRIWVEVDTEEEPKPYTFLVYGTGWDIPDDSNIAWFGTATLGDLVWHVFVESP